MNFVKFLGTPYFIEHLRWLLLYHGVIFFFCFSLSSDFSKCYHEVNTLLKLDNSSHKMFLPNVHLLPKKTWAIEPPYLCKLFVQIYIKINHMMRAQPPRCDLGFFILPQNVRVRISG